jgi:hypothetical protein
MLRQAIERMRERSSARPFCVASSMEAPQTRLLKGSIAKDVHAIGKMALVTRLELQGCEAEPVYYLLSREQPWLQEQAPVMYDERGRPRAGETTSLSSDGESSDDDEMIAALQAGVREVERVEEQGKGREARNEGIERTGEGDKAEVDVDVVEGVALRAGEKRKRAVDAEAEAGAGEEGKRQRRSASGSQAVVTRVTSNNRRKVREQKKKAGEEQDRRCQEEQDLFAAEHEEQLGLLSHIRVGGSVVRTRELESIVRNAQGFASKEALVGFRDVLRFWRRLRVRIGEHGMGSQSCKRTASGLAPASQSSGMVGGEEAKTTRELMEQLRRVYRVHEAARNMSHLAVGSERASLAELHRRFEATVCGQQREEREGGIEAKVVSQGQGRKVGAATVVKYRLLGRERDGAGRLAVVKRDADGEIKQLDELLRGGKRWDAFERRVGRMGLLLLPDRVTSGWVRGLNEAEFAGFMQLVEERAWQLGEGWEAIAGIGWSVGTGQCEVALPKLQLEQQEVEGIDETCWEEVGQLFREAEKRAMTVEVG